MIRPMLWHEMEPHHCVNGWLASEKLRGFRAVYDNRTRQLYSRERNLFPAPEWFLDGLPDAVLDGELFHSREGAESAVQSAINRKDFTGLSFHTFDAPLHFGSFFHRLEYVYKVCVGTSAIAVPHEVVIDYDHAREIARRYKLAGGEGVVVRDPRALYRQGSRVEDALKFKP